MQNKYRAQTIDRPTGSLPGLVTLNVLAMPVFAMLVLVGCGGEQPATSEAQSAPRPVRVVLAQESVQATDLRIPGALRAQQRATLAFLNDGYLAEREARIGDRVEAGTALATLYNPALQPGLAAAEADMREAATRLDQLEIDTRRQALLVERKLVSDDALEQTRTRRNAARAALEQAQARLDQARAQLEDAALRAPFAGRIVDVMAEPGDFARAGQPIMSIADDRSLEVRVHLPQSRADRIGVGDAVGIRLQDTGRMLPGRVRELGLAAPGNPLPVVIEPANDEPMALYPGQPVYLEFGLSASDKVRIPLNAVINPGTGAARVFIAREGRAEQVSVELGRLDAGWVEIFGPIQPGDPIIVAGQANLLDAEPVRIID